MDVTLTFPDYMPRPSPNGYSFSQGGVDATTGIRSGGLIPFRRFQRSSKVFRASYAVPRHNYNNFLNFYALETNFKVNPFRIQLYIGKDPREFVVMFDEDPTFSFASYHDVVINCIFREVLG